MADSKKIFDYYLKFYRRTQFPALAAQFDEWSVVRPLEGLRIADANPIFRNSLVKYAALVAAGADVTVISSARISKDKKILDMLPDFGLIHKSVVKAESDGDVFDVVLDCGASAKNLKSKLGYAELTRTGAYGYEHCQKPVYLADGGRVKRLETCLGTGDGFVRGMKRLCETDFKNKKILIFGCGKVGFGIAWNSIFEGAKVTVVENPEKIRGRELDVDVISIDDFDAVTNAALGSWCVVTATGIAGGVANSADWKAVVKSPALLANMGVDDEFGSAVPAGRVLNRKEAVNFVLDEPTLVKYIDGTLALHNLGAEKLLRGGLRAGLNPPAADDEEKILHIIRSDGEVFVPEMPDIFSF